MHVKLWYEGNIWDASDPAHKSVLQVIQTTLLKLQKHSFISRHVS